MANYVRTRLSIADAIGFERYLSNSGFDFNKVIPEPNHIFDCASWRIANWGTADNALRNILRFYEGVWDVSFGTSWSAPLEVIEELSRQMPESKIRFWCLNDTQTLGIEGYAFGGSVDLEVLDMNSHGGNTLLHLRC